MDYKVISADTHLDVAWLPGDLFTNNAPAHLKDKMPYVADQKTAARHGKSRESICAAPVSEAI